MVSRSTCEAFESLDKQRRQCVTEAEQLKADRNAATAEIGKLRKAGTDTTERQQQVRAMGERIAELDERAEKIDLEFRDLLARIPNLPHESVPVGKSEARQRGSAALGHAARVSISRRRRIGIWGRNWEFWIWSAPLR